MQRRCCGISLILSKMPVTALQHINIRAADASRTRDFYVRILGLRVGDRPPFRSTGYWLYLGADPVLHIVQKTPDEPPSAQTTGAIDHVAFRGVDIEATRQALMREGLAFEERVVPRDNTSQLFVLDPDGIRIELNF
jgi:catechol 2,3-dioxygenase-like lactoylglutathione lyase family enzyme